MSYEIKSSRQRIMSVASVIAMASLAMVSSHAHAQAVPPSSAAADAPPATPQAAEGPAVPAEDGGRDIVVTGSRVIQDGYRAPTPVAVLSGAALEQIAPTNIADAVNRLPALNGSITPRTSITSVSSGALGANQLNLRGLGAGRTLVLLDGKRVINSSANTGFSAPDVNTIPNGLISRVDVVTGGASAAYGSDALAGVVNFVLDRKFSGIKGSVQGGVTTYGDDENYLASLTVGHGFADDKVHVLLSGELAHNAGIRGTPRPWNDVSANVVTNPAYTATNGQPFYLLARQVGVATGTPGGVITRGPLRGVVFGANGTPGIYNFGSTAATGNIQTTGAAIGNVQTGGDWRYSRIDDGVDLDGRSTRATAYGRIAFALTDDIELYAEGQYARTEARSTATPNRRLNNLTILADNAFIPSAVATRVAALGLPSFVIGTTNADIGRVVVNNQRDLSRYAVGTDGKFGIGGSTWNWDVYYQRSQNVVRAGAENVGYTANYLRAVDAVRSPTTGAIVCRSTITNPNDGCVPYNPMGTGVNTSQAIAYVTGTARRREVLTQDLASASINGSPISTWAGPVQFALGYEHRREALRGQADALSEANAYFAGNYHASRGSYNVDEGFLEVELPLAKDASWAKSLDLNGAIRATDYSTSGYVTTWKVGGVYAPVSDIRFRATHSRDIRAPNLGELFSAGQTQSGTSLFDPFTNTTLSNSFALTAGNPNLKPEKADTDGVGVVISPSFAPGLQGSVDFYSIRIKDAVAVPGVQSVVNLCFAGNQALCGAITRVNGVINTVGVLPQNIATQSTKGLDLDLTYQLPLANVSSGLSGRVTLHGSANYVFSLKTEDNTGVYQGAGVLGSFTTLNATALTTPRFRSNATIAYSDETFDLNVTWRHVAGGVYNRDFVACEIGACPTSVPLYGGITAGNTISGNRIASNDLFDVGVSYRPIASARGAEIFVAVDNVFNKAPPLIYGVVQDGYYQGQSNFAYDRIGRSFRAGLRFSM